MTCAGAPPRSPGCNSSRLGPAARPRTDISHRRPSCPLLGAAPQTRTMTAAAQREAAAARRRRARECAGDAYLTARELAARREAHAFKRSRAAKERRDARAALFHETCGELRRAAYDRARRRAIRGDMAVAKCERAGAAKRKVIAERKAAELRRVAQDAAVLARKALAKVVTRVELVAPQPRTDHAARRGARLWSNYNGCCGPRSPRRTGPSASWSWV